MVINIPYTMAVHESRDPFPGVRPTCVCEPAVVSNALASRVATTVPSCQVERLPGRGPELPTIECTVRAKRRASIRRTQRKGTTGVR